MMKPDQRFSWLSKYAWLPAISAVLIIVLMATGAQHLGFSGNYRVFFDKGDTRVTAYDRIQNTYSQADNILFVVSATDGLFTEDALTAIRELTERSWTLPHVSRVDSISNFQHSKAVGDDLLVEDLVGRHAQLTDAKTDNIRQIANAEPSIAGLLLSGNNQVTGINLTVQLPAEDANALPALVAQARDIADKLRSDYPDLELRMAGEVMLTNAFIEATVNDFTSLLPLMFLIVIVVIAVVLRSVVATVYGVIYALLSIVGAMGAAGWTGMMLTPPTSVAPTIILTIAVAIYVHIYMTFQQQRQQLLNGINEGQLPAVVKREALLMSLKLNVKPVTLTSLTTVIGFLTMNFSTVPPFRDLGNVIAFGVVCSYVLSFTLLPALLLMTPAKSTATGSPFERPLGFMGQWVSKRPTTLFFIVLATAVTLGLLAPRNEISEKFIEQFSHDIEFRHTAEYVNDNLTGVYNIEYSLDSGKEAGVYDPGYMQSLDNFSRWLRNQEEIVHVRTFSDTLKRLNKNLHGDDQSFYALPGNREEIAQYILLYEMSLPYGLGVSDQISLNKSATRVVATFGNLSTKEAIALEEKIDRWASENLTEMTVHSGSPTLMFSHIGDENVRSMVVGFGIGFVLIGIFLAFAFRSIRFGVLAMIANTLPITSAFGLWALLVGEVGMGVSVVAGMTLGIVVDDTVHFINKYLYARRTLDMPPAESITYCFSTVGVALLCTTIILVCGFSVICFSDFARNASMAQMNVMTIILALVYDFIFLPATILIMERLFNEKSKEVRESARFDSAEPSRG
ncbi:MMPL family transporter [Aurantivibrio plasticivorans]